MTPESYTFTATAGLRALPDDRAIELTDEALYWWNRLALDMSADALQTAFLNSEAAPCTNPNTGA